MVDIHLEKGQSGYAAVNPYLKRYWERHYYDDLVVALETSYDGVEYDATNELVIIDEFCDFRYQSDWWEGQSFIRIMGISAILELKISGGVYEKEE